MPPKAFLRAALRPRSSSRRDRALAECVLGAQALQLGKTDIALKRYAAGVALAPDDADVAALHGVALRSAGRLPDAQRELIRAIGLDATRADSFTQLAQTYRMAGDLVQASQAFLAAALLRTADAIAWRDAGEALRLAGRLDDGLEAARHAAALSPSDPSITNTTALLLHRAGRVDDALALCEQSRTSGTRDLHLTLTHAMLLRTIGRYDEGWALYERRLELPELQRRPHQPSTPRWTGNSLAGRCILVRAEQGLGDQVQFVRWASLLRAHGAARVIVQAAFPLVRLLKTVPGIDAVVAADLPAPPHHVHVDMLSLPHLLRSGMDMHHELVPYVSAPGTAPDAAAAIVQKPASTLRIGLVWGGTPHHADDATRTMALRTLGSVVSREDVQVMILQQGAVRSELDELTAPVRARLLDVAPSCADMGDTAHMISRCDVVLSVDTSVAHVAGAMGVETWVMVAEPAEWRWGRARPDSIFYPTVRIFRQQRPGDWSDVVRQLHDAIDARLAGRASA